MKSNSLIESEHISIIIQGPLYRRTRSPLHLGILHTLPKLKELFPNAEFIISTWKDEDVSGLEASVIIQSEEPEVFLDINESTRNLNKQIVSTLMGIKSATRKFILKTRSDVLIESTNIAQITKKNESALFDYPITMTNMVFRNHTKIPFLFHISDVVQFGTKKDMLDLWDIPLERWDEVGTNGKKNIFFRYSASCFKYHPEQSICKRWLEKYGYQINLSSPSHFDFNLFKIWEEVLIKNFFIIEHTKVGITFPPHFYTSALGNSTLMTQSNVLSIAELNGKKSRAQLIRFLALWSQKYIFCIFNRFYLMSLTLNIIFYLSPSLNKSIFKLYRKIRVR